MTIHREPHVPELQRPPWIWVVLLLATGAVGLVAVYFAWDEIPDPFPSHWNIRGEADAFTEKTWKQMIFMFGLPTVIFTLCIAGSFAFLHQQAAHIRGEDWKIARARAQSNAMLKPLGFWMVILNAVIIANMYLSVTGQKMSTMLLIVAIFILVGFMMWNIASVQRWLDKHYPDPKISKHMKWGFFYHNPDDPNLMVHNDMNSTFNMAHKGAWVAVGALIGFPIILIAVLIIVEL